MGVWHESGLPEVVGALTKSESKLSRKCLEAAESLYAGWEAAQAADDPRSRSVATPASDGGGDVLLPVFGMEDVGLPDLMSLDDPSTGEAEPELDPEVEAVVAIKDHQVFDGKPDLFGDSSRGILINRKKRRVGGRPWASRDETLKTTDESVLKSIPTAALEAKQQRSSGIVFAPPDQLEKIRFFLKTTAPLEVSEGDPSEEKIRTEMESAAQGDHEGHGKLEEMRRHEEQLERGQNIKNILALAEEEDDEGNVKRVARVSAFATSHVHLPPSKVGGCVPRHVPRTPDCVANEQETQSAFAYHIRSFSKASPYPTLHPDAWKGYEVDKSIPSFPPPTVSRALSGIGGILGGGLAGIVAKLSGSRVAPAEEPPREGSTSRRSASPGSSLPRGASSGSAPSLNNLSMIVKKLGGSVAASANPVDTLSQRLGKLGSLIPSLAARPPSQPTHSPSPQTQPSLPPVGEFAREPYDPKDWWHLLPEELGPVTNRPQKHVPCHFFVTVLGCQHGAQCPFEHAPGHKPDYPPKGIEALWPKFFFEILPARRARRGTKQGPPTAPPSTAPGQYGRPGGYDSRPPPSTAPGQYGRPGRYDSRPPPSTAPGQYGRPGGYDSRPPPGYGASASASSSAPGRSYGGGYGAPRPVPGGSTAHHQGYGPPPAQRPAMSRAPEPPARTNNPYAAYGIHK
jgi:hypothetical protein